METMTFGACVKKSWSSTLQAFARLPVFFLCIFAVLACTALLRAQIQQTLHADPQAPGAIGNSLLSMLLFILQLVAGGLVTIKVSRFVVLDEGVTPLVPHGGRPLGRYAVLWILYMVGMGLSFVLFPLIAHVVKIKEIAYLAGPMLLVYAYIAARLNLLYPAVALGQSIRFGAAWRDSRGHFWSLFGTCIVTLLPVGVLAGIVLAVVGTKQFMAPDQSTLVSLAIAGAVFNTLIATVVASTVGWLYRRYANELTQTPAE